MCLCCVVIEGRQSRTVMAGYLRIALPDANAKNATQ